MDTIRQYTQSNLVYTITELSEKEQNIYPRCKRSKNFVALRIDALS